MDLNKVRTSGLLQHEWLAPLPDILEDDLESLSSKTYKDISVQRALFCSVLEDTKIKLQCAVMLKTHLPVSPDKTKVDADKKHVFDVINNSYIELAQRRTYAALRNAVREFLDLEEYRCSLAVTEQRNKAARKKIAKQLRIQRKRHKLQLYDINAKIEHHRRALSDAHIVFKVQSRYTDHWEGARAEQHTLDISRNESKLRSNIVRYDQKFGQEQRVHNEVMLFVQNAIDETLSKTEFWMNKYDDDLEKIDIEVQIQMKKFLSMRDKSTEMEELIVKRDKEMTDWRSFKEERENVRLYHELMTNAAYAIQAWWRGLLVRLQLGPYKPKKEKRKKNKKK